MTTKKDILVPSLAIWPSNSLITSTLKDIKTLFPESLIPPDEDDEEDEESLIQAHTDLEYSRGFGTSFRCVWEGKFVQAKRVNANVFLKKSTGLLDTLLSLQSLLSIPNSTQYLVPCYGVSWNEKDSFNLYFISQLSPETSLFNILTNPKKKVDEKLQISALQKASILLDVVSGIKFLHSHGVIHGRLKDTNVLLYPGFQAKLSDFCFHTHFTNESRIYLKGTHGIRWTPPEIVQMEEELDTELNDSRQSFSHEVYQESYQLNKNIDIYDIGVLAIALFNEKPPFQNIPWDEGVKKLLLEGTLPTLMSRYPDKQYLDIFNLKFIPQCLRPYDFRPTIDEIYPMVEHCYYDVYQSIHKNTLQTRQEDINNVKEELKDILIEYEEKKLLVDKGKEIITKKENEKIRIHDPKLKREREIEIQKAREKLRGFMKEFKVLEEDKEGAENDLEQLLDIQKELTNKLALSQAEVVSTRHNSQVTPEIDVLMQQYATEQEIIGFIPHLKQQTFKTPITETWTPSILLSSPLRSLFESSENPQVNIVTPSLSPPPSVFTSSQTIHPTDSYHSDYPNQSYHIEQDEWETERTSIYKYQNKGQADSDDDDEEIFGHLPSISISPGQPLPQFYDSLKETKQPQTTTPTPIPTPNPTPNLTPSISSKPKNITELLKEVESFQITISQSLVTEEEITSGQEFPIDDNDILHVQYLAAARGDWFESVGLRRLSFGFSDELIASLYDNNFTPVHLAAFIGNFNVLVQFIDEAGYEADGVDNNGDTPLHCACKRGHINIVKYLVEVHGLSPRQENNNYITPIQYALKGGYLTIVEYFMEYAPIRIQTTFVDSQFGASLLHWAALAKRIELIEYLVTQQNISIDAVDRIDQATCLHWACFGSTKEVVQHLIERSSANPQACDKFGNTCLHLATASGDVEKTIYLMDDVKLKITDKNLDLFTPYDVANGACALFLQERKAKGFVTGSIAEKNRRDSRIVKK